MAAAVSASFIVVGGFVAGSVTIIHLQDGLIFKRQNTAKFASIKSFSDMDKSFGIAGFNGAKDILAYAPHIDKLKLYREFADQEQEVALLASDRVDAMVGDGMILTEHHNALKERAKAGEKLGFDPNFDLSFKSGFFPRENLNLVLHDQGMRDHFNACFQTIQQNGILDKIIMSVWDKYKTALGGEYPEY